MILLINDDGIEHPGLRAMYAALRKRTGLPVLVVVPTQQRSGLSHAITLDRGLSVTPRLEADFFAFAVDGTPTDCTKLGLTVLCSEPPRLVVSGINDGPNVGRSLFYSGTVGAAMEGAVEGFAGLAVNRDHGDGGFTDAATLAAEVAAWMLEAPAAFRGRVLNLNVPAGERARWRPLRLAAHGHSGFREGYKPVRDARDHIVWRLAGEWVSLDDGESDADLLGAGHPVATMLMPDLNGDQRALQPLVDRLGAAAGRS